MSYDVFISHSARDHAVAEAACDAIERAGHLCWLAPRDLGDARDAEAARLGAIGAGKVLLLILSAASADAKPVLRDVERARQAGLAIVPLRIEDVEPGDRLHYQIADAIPIEALQPPLGDHLAHLTAIVGRLLEGGEGAPLRPLTMPPQPMPRRPTPSWLPVAVAGLVGLAAIAVVAAVAVR